MSLFKGNNKIAGSSNYQMNPTDSSNQTVTFVDDGNTSGYDTFDSVNSEITTGSMLSKLFTCVKRGLKFLDNKCVSLDDTLTSTRTDLYNFKDEENEWRNDVNEHLRRGVTGWTALQAINADDGVQYRFQVNTDSTVTFYKSTDNGATWENTNLGFNSTLVLTRTTDLSGTADNGPALCIGARTGQHIEIDTNEIHAKKNGTTVDVLNLNLDGGTVKTGGSLVCGGSVRFTKFLEANDGVTNWTVIKVYDDADASTAYGAEMVIGANGNTYIGSGESPGSLYNANGSGNGETMYVTADTNINLVCNCNTIANRKSAILSSSAFYPGTDAAFTLGTSSLRWGKIYSNSSSISTSDRNRKHDIQDISESTALPLIMGLKPVTYKYKNSVHNRTHWGLVAQDVEELLNELNIPTIDFAAFVKSEKETCDEKTGELSKVLDENGNPIYEYGLRYEEFIAPLISTVQYQQKEIESLKERLDKIENLITVTH